MVVLLGKKASFEKKGIFGDADNVPVRSDTQPHAPPPLPCRAILGEVPMYEYGM